MVSAVEEQFISKKPPASSSSRVSHDAESRSQRHIYAARSSIAKPNHQTPNIQATIPNPTLLSAPLVGASLPTLPPVPPTPRELVAPAGILQLTLPQTYPLGQHPPPSPAAQVIQPLAQAPVARFPGAVIPVPLGATIVKELVGFETSVVDAIAGQDVDAQSRPV